MSERPKGRTAFVRAAWGLSAVFALVVGRLKLLQHERLQTSAFDLGVYANVLWNTAHGRPFFNAFDGRSFLGQHFIPALALLAPLLRVWSDAAALLAFQSAALALAIPAVYLLAERELDDRRAALGFAALCAVFAPLHRASAYDFHPATLAVPLLAWSLYFWRSGRRTALLATLALTALVQEDLPLVLVGFGAYAAWEASRRRDRNGRRDGLVVAAVAAPYFALVVFVLMPHFAGGWRASYWEYYARLGMTPGSLAAGFVLHPWRLWALTLGDPEKAAAVLGLVGFTSGLILLAPREALLLAIPLALNLISANPAQYRLQAHYSATMIPFLFYAMIAGYARLSRRGALRGPRALAALALAAAGSLWNLPVYSRPTDAARLQSARALFAEIGPDDSVAASANLVPHLCFRNGITMLNGPDTPARWVALDARTRVTSYLSHVEADFAGRHLDRLVFTHDDLYLFDMKRAP